MQPQVDAAGVVVCAAASWHQPQWKLVSMGPVLNELLHRLQILVLHKQQSFFEGASRVIADTRLQQGP